ncbi:TetR/AcrR family transcriptional regulator [Clostridium septicum]|uniref:TetR/AcrR family transcriptional regulator n=1 Tax=Clostridium septicum TaxID=1504 RepID=A0A9N7JN86_CLOSE|nr:TetR/AcrR family transcriptional regulator [Clostridium septicum]AYE35723.1 TetR/AcrR family transcriptional regulator [Clostridium septicum]MDU1314923.1 TetR/AcrR family transcriptional regulator [Clostridium septicum]QAS61062.1 TetR/AcrR family transcriptional regulator [Clostridium septicum]UEC19603.1 TetR/AcrR family transcriptional regulator [Clostridium septicum]USS02338.1 TetR/AcrR family transcriptional regulator [Clostridium septicum]
MPKVIENIEEKIFDAAIKLFGERGYENVDMKAIAKESNIAVGTLYNYYSNKKDLYIRVLETSWEGTFNKIKKISNSIKNDLNKLGEIIECLYYDIKARKGLGHYFIKGNFESKDKEELNADKIVKKIVLSLYEENNTIKEKDELEVEKLVYILLCTIVLLVNKYSTEDKENVEILMKIVNNFI